MSLSHCNKCFCRFDACSECDVGAYVQELRDQLSSITAELVAANENVKKFMALQTANEGLIRMIKGRAEAAEAERDALKARINHKSVGTAARYPGDNEVAYLLHTKNDEEEAERDDMEVVKLYAAPIPSPDTAELLQFIADNDAFIYKKRSDVGTMTYQLWTQDEDEEFHMLHDEKKFFATPVDAVMTAIRSRSTKEK